MRRASRRSATGFPSPPPQTAGGLKALKPVRTVIGTGDFIIHLVRTFDTDIVRIKCWNGIMVAQLRDAIHVGGATFANRSADIEVVFSPRSLSPLLVKAEAGLLYVENGKTGLHLPCPLRAERIMVVDNSLYALHQGDLTEIRVNELGDRTILSPGRVWKVLPKAVTVLQSMLYENVLGKAHLLIPFRPGACQRLVTPELDGCKIIDGRWENGVAVIIGYRDGRYDRFVFHFNRAHTHYRLRVEENIDLPAVNFVTLDNGINVHLTQAAMEIFSHHPTQGALRIVSNPPDAAIILAKDGTVVLCFKDRRLYRLSLNS